MTARDAVEAMVGRWPGYDEQSWSERFSELDRRYRSATETADMAVRLVAEKTALLTAQQAEIEAKDAEIARSSSGVAAFCEMLEHGYAPFVEGVLSQAICCSGHHCGCRGASVGEYLAHLLRQDTGLARAALAGGSDNADPTAIGGLAREDG